MSTVVDSDLTLAVEGGKVRASGTHRELLRDDELYRDLTTSMRLSDLTQHETARLPRR